MKTCPACRIIRKEQAAEIVYEDEHCLAFLHCQPLNAGHCLLVPKVHEISINAVPDEIRAHLMIQAPKIAQVIVRAMKADAYNLHLAHGDCAGQDMPHASIHLIPRRVDDGFSWNWRSIADVDLAACASDIRAKMEKIR